MALCIYVTVSCFVHLCQHNLVTIDTVLLSEYAQVICCPGQDWKGSTLSAGFLSLPIFLLLKNSVLKQLFQSLYLLCIILMDRAKLGAMKLFFFIIFKTNLRYHVPMPIQQEARAFTEAIKINFVRTSCCPEATLDKSISLDKHHTFIWKFCKGFNFIIYHSALITATKTQSNWKDEKGFKTFGPRVWYPLYSFHVHVL